LKLFEMNLFKFLNRFQFNNNLIFYKDINAQLLFFKECTFIRDRDSNFLQYIQPVGLKLQDKRFLI